MDTIEQKLIERVKAELEPLDTDTLYDEMLDEIYGEINVGVTLSASKVLSECDPTAYRCGFSDWLDNEITVGRISDEIDGEYYDADEVDRIKEEIESEEDEDEINER